MDLAVSAVEYKTDLDGQLVAQLRPAMRVLSNHSGVLASKWTWAGTKQDYDPDRYDYVQMLTTV